MNLLQLHFTEITIACFFPALLCLVRIEKSCSCLIRFILLTGKESGFSINLNLSLGFGTVGFVAEKIYIELKERDEFMIKMISHFDFCFDVIGNKNFRFLSLSC